MYSRPFFEGGCIGDISVCVPLWTEDPTEALAPVAAALEGHEVTRVLCVPQSTNDVLSATAAAELADAPLVAYIMDDSNVFRGGITDRAMRLLIDRSAICFAISPLLCDLYQRKFSEPFWLLPPVNDSVLFAPPDLRPPANREPRGVIIGNVWSSEVVTELRSAIGPSGLRVDWYGNAGRPLVETDAVDLAGDGIALHANLTDEPLVRELRHCDYSIMPSREPSEEDPQNFLYRASLPSRLIYVFTTAHLPVIVLGGADTTAGQFITRLGLGRVSPYEPEQFARAVRSVTTPPERDAIRARATALSPKFTAEPVADWIWRSAAVGRPIDTRYERLFADAGLRPARLAVGDLRRQRFSPPAM